MLLLVAGALLAGCSVQNMATDALADALSNSARVYAAEEDPELIRAAMPFALKTTETLLVDNPDHPGLLKSACSGYTQYTYAFVETDAEIAEADDFEEAERLRERAVALYLRARDYCLRALELSQPGIADGLRRAPDEAVRGIGEDEISLLFWTGASWGKAISLALDRPDLVVDLEAVRAIMKRTLELDESWDDGGIHEVMIAVEALPEAMGGSPERARQHFRRAVELSDGASASPYVALASTLSITEQNRAEFERLLDDALAVDPTRNPAIRLSNHLAQEKAKRLLARSDELFLE
jgi:predicted anti-sigma-YlaC factor YlaD